MTDEQTFADYRSRLNIKDVLEDAGYTFYKRDGLRYPAYVRLGSDGKRISGDKYIVMPNKNCCFQPPTIKLYSTLLPPSSGNIQTFSRSTSMA